MFQKKNKGFRFQKMYLQIIQTIYISIVFIPYAIYICGKKVTFAFRTWSKAKFARTTTAQPLQQWLIAKLRCNIVIIMIVSYLIMFSGFKTYPASLSHILGTQSLAHIVSPRFWSALG